ncbi:hypothetical protein C4M96_03660 [Mycoplasmopsis pullorum]|uniref:hypothetical protein n=1 Tax=Mycoplasmopsis pullorum TaxID=48003 RepID=UPI0011187FE3|nr:hypothetical protein [Mycoplasmopsis pullorum]TNK82795.1 hypothetical protein C4M93_03515 [Mycoplasmopsis pullorum]TNK91715.1 hypothetical protein C4M96_03660 [Mycoplasmopsis pullorum]
MEIQDIYTYHLGENQVYLHRINIDKTIREVNFLLEQSNDEKWDKFFKKYHCQTCFSSFYHSLDTDRLIKSDSMYKKDEKLTDYKTANFHIILCFGKEINKNLTNKEITHKLRKILKKEIFNTYKEIIYNAYEETESNDIIIKTPNVENIEKVVLYDLVK